MILEVAVSLFLIWTIWYISIICIKKQGMPPGPFPFPWIGNIPHVISDQAFPFRKLSKEYGDIFTVFLPNGTCVVLNTASLARNARLATKDDLAGRSFEIVYPLQLIFGNDVVASDYSTGYLFRKRVFKSSLHVFGSGLAQVEDRARHAVQLALQEIEKCQSFSPTKLVPSSMYAQVWEWLTSKKITVDDPIISLFNEIQAVITNQPMETSIYLLIPFLGYITNNFNRRMERAQQIKKQLFPQEFSAHRETYIPGVIRDLTDSFISAYEKEIAKRSSKDIGSLEDIPNLMLDVVLATVDTVSSAISWFILYNILHQDIQAKLHKELDDVIRNDHLPCWQDAPKMPYLQATLCEVLRKCTPVPITGTTAIRDTTIAGYHIPKNTNVIINITEIHHDPKEWPEPNEFKPERFLDSDGKFVGWTTKHAFMPFGLGHRECLGQTFAKIVMFTFASTLLRLYKIELPEGAEKPTTSPIDLQIHHPKDFTVVARKRH